MDFLPIYFFRGLLVSFSLIAVIGMQNAFVLKQGIIKNHVFVIAAFCSLVDAIFITLGVNGLGLYLLKHQLILKIFHWGGIIFVIVYGTLAFRSCFKNNSLTLDNQPKPLALKEVMAILFTVSFLNPMVYLDSCVVMASITAYLGPNEKVSFTIGAVLASCIWFFSLGYGSRLLKKFFAKTTSWKILDFLIGCVMYSIAFKLILQRP